MNNNKIGRREFVKKSTLTSSGFLAMPMVGRSGVYIGNSSKDIRIALLGCGGRGTGAAVQALIAHKDVKLVAMADVFQDRLEGSLRSIKEEVRSEEHTSELQ